MNHPKIQSPNHDSDCKFCRGNLAAVGRTNSVVRPKGYRSGSVIPLVVGGALPDSYCLHATGAGTVAVTCRFGERRRMVGEFFALPELRWIVRELRSAKIRRKIVTAGLSNSGGRPFAGNSGEI